MQTVTEVLNQSGERRSINYNTETTYLNPSHFVKLAVYIVNRTGKKISKLNRTILNNIIKQSIGKNIEEVNLEYVDLHSLSDETLVKNSSERCN